MPDIDLNRAAGILREIMPEARPSGVARMSGGGISGAHVVTFADGSAPVALKVYAEDEGWRLDNETFVYRLLREHGVTAIPTLLGSAPTERSPIGRPYLLTSKLAGIAVEDFTPNASADQVAAIYRQMGAILRQIHGIELEAFGDVPAEVNDTEPTNRAFMRRLFGERVAIYLEHTGDRGTFEAAHKYVADHADLFALCTTPVLLHNDFHEGNVLVDLSADGPGGTVRPVVSGFVDVENAMAGDPVVDFVKLDSFSMRGDRDRLRALFDGYGSVPVQWEARRRLYRLIHDFELWAWFHMIGEGAFQDELVADARDIIAAG